jgi:serine/threonine protein kinase
MRVITEIARGGFGRVEKVKLPDGTLAARKVYDPAPAILSATDAGKLRKRFEREVRVQSSLPDAYFLPVIGQDLSASPPWFLMPLADQNFEQRIAEARANGDNLINDIADILNALEELHTLGFAHRDLKPQNILRHEGRWKLSDFGLVMPTSPFTTTLTSTNSAWGSQSYAAPEQALDFKHVTSKVDIYAVGCILHDIYGGGPSSRIPYRRQSCAGAVGQIIEKCTEDNPGKRFKNVTALRSAIVMALATPHALHTSPNADQWLSELDSIASWDTSKQADFSRFLASATTDDKTRVFMGLDEEKLIAIHALNADLWYAVANEFCAWAYGGFEFSFCDVLIKRLEKVYDLGDLEIKSAAALAAAQLGASHNRWFVMRRLFHMCGHQIDTNLARRMAIDILASEMQFDFARCADGIKHTADDYHPVIAQAIQPDASTS